MADINIPVPKVEVPKIEVPKIEVPKIEVPPIPKLPEFNVPKIKLPTFDVPKLKLPNFKIPDLKAALIFKELSLKKVSLDLKSKLKNVTKKNTIDKSSQDEVLKKVQEDLTPIEQSIKTGGNGFITYEKDLHVTVGSIMNTFPCYREDSHGEFRPKAVEIAGTGSFVRNDTVNYIEEVENSRFPCGTYTVNATNRLDLNSGAGGAAFSSAGNMRIGSVGRTIFTAGKEMYISVGDGNLNMTAGKNISIKADTVNLAGGNQVVIESNLGVVKNAIINGCAFVDGELYVNHITAPCEIQYTGGGIGSFGQMTHSKLIGYADLSYVREVCKAKGVPWELGENVPIYSLSEKDIPLASKYISKGKNQPDTVFVLPHQHPFHNIPLTFTDGNESLRNKAASLNSGVVGVASNIEHGYKEVG